MKSKIFIGDFETTVYEGQEFTEVWASGLVALGTEDVKIFHSIEETFDFLLSLQENVTVYYHNLKFDGEFWLSFLLTKAKYKQAYYKLNRDGTSLKWYDTKDMPSKTFKYIISDMGQWYGITIKKGKQVIEIKDSLKLLPFKVQEIGTGFKTKHQKLDMEYKGFRFAGCKITKKEKEYLANDLLVVKEALEIMFEQGHTKLTIGTCCLDEYKKICNHSVNSELSYDEMFPQIYEKELDEQEYGSPNVGEYIKKSYKGGWCYVVKHRIGKVAKNGVTADVNSLYPSMMSSESGNRFPIGNPYFWKGEIPEIAKGDDKYFFVRIRTKFYIKKDHLPFVQIKNTLMYEGTAALETSDIYDEKTGKYYDKVYGLNGELEDVKVTLTLTMTDYYLLLDHYELVDCEYLDGCWFYSKVGIFDEYINPYKELKQKSKGAMRQLAKLFLNNLYGKFATNTNSSFKVAYVKEDGSLGYYIVKENDKKAGYIPVGSAITSYARNFTIRTAQANYHGEGKRGFIYADTDSIHCDLSPEELVNVPVHPTEFCHWKLESCWDIAIFVRQKTYIEHIIAEDLEPIDTPYNNIKCAGMPDKAKNLFDISMTGNANINDEWTDDEKEFLFQDGKPIKRNYEDFKIGLELPDKLRPVRIKGGIVLMDSTYKIR